MCGSLFFTHLSLLPETVCQLRAAKQESGPRISKRHQKLKWSPEHETGKGLCPLSMDDRHCS